MIVYSLQTEPFIHIDLDTFLYTKYTVPEDIRVFYAKKDVLFERGKSQYTNSMNLFDTYLRGVSGLDTPLPKEFTKYMDFMDIPNMNIFGGKDYELIKEATKYALRLYEDNITHYDSEYRFACVVEQFYISSAIKMLYGSHYNNHYLYESGDGFSVKYNEDSDKEYDYPIQLIFANRTKLISDENHLYQFVNYDFNTTVHLCGNKYDSALQFIFKETAIQKYFCEAQITMINKIFPENLECDSISKRYYKKLIYNSNKWSGTYPIQFI